MAKTIEYYFSLNSPWTYMGGPRLIDMVARHGATVVVKPMNLAEVFPSTGGLPLPKRAPARQAYRLAEMERWRDYLHMPLTIQPAFFPANEALAVHTVIAAQRQGLDALGLSQAYLRAVWAEERNIGDEATVATILAEQKLPADLLETGKTDETLADERAANSKEAVERNVFGSPFYIIDGEGFWGQDRLDFVERILAA